jgi:drug/metabolite transporter (DMT)-like permease
MLNITDNHNEQRHSISIFAVNYLVCLVVAGFYLFQSNKVGIWNQSGWNVAVLFGLISGIFYLLGYMLLQRNIEKNGVAMSSTFMKLGVLVPTLMAVLFFHEVPQIFQIIGILLALIAIVIVNLEKQYNKIEDKISLLLLLLTGGMADAMSNLYNQIGNPNLKNYFLFLTFVAAFLFSIIVMLVKKQKFSKLACLLGIILGIPNYYSCRFLLLSLGSVPAIVVYPFFSVATIITTSIIGSLFFKEKLSDRKKVALALILVALVFLNI